MTPPAAQPAPRAAPPAAAPAPTTTLTVSRLGRGDYQTIGEALKAAPDGAEIRVKPGLYQEEIVIDRPVEIVGDGPLGEIVVESTHTNCVAMETDYAVVRGLTLRGRAGRAAKKKYAVDIPQGRLVLEDCDITSDSGACVGIHGSTANPVIRACQIHDGKSGGVWVYNNGEGTVEDCDIFDNANTGVYVKEGGNPLIRRCQINRNKYQAVWAEMNGRGTVENCDLTGNEGGAWLIEDTSEVVQQGNTED